MGVVFYFFSLDKNKWYTTTNGLKKGTVLPHAFITILLLAYCVAVLFIRSKFDCISNIVHKLKC